MLLKILGDRTQSNGLPQLKEYMVTGQEKFLKFTDGHTITVSQVTMKILYLKMFQ